MNWSSGQIKRLLLIGVCISFIAGFSFMVRSSIRESVLKRSPVRVESTKMRILRAQDLADHYRESFRGAEKRIWISTFSTSDPASGGWMGRVVEELRGAAKRGVEVRLLLPKELADNRKIAQYYEDKPIEVGLHGGDQVLHSKIILVDDDQVYGGSANFSFSAFLRESETSIWHKSKKLNNQLETYYEQLWEERVR